MPAKVGDTLLEVAKEFDIDLEGACEGTLSCSTCHLIVDPEWYGKIPDPLTEEEQDMLDLAYGLTDTYVSLLFLCLCCGTGMGKLVNSCKTISGGGT